MATIKLEGAEVLQEALARIVKVREASHTFDQIYGLDFIRIHPPSVSMLFADLEPDLEMKKNKDGVWVLDRDK